MKQCTNCQTQNRDKAKYCKHCGKVLQTAAGKEFADFQAKDNLKDELEKFKSRIKAFQRLKANGAVIHIQMDCVILGDAGTGKNFLAHIDIPADVQQAYQYLLSRNYTPR